MKIIDLTLTIKTDCGKFTIKKLGTDFICTSPIAGLNKQSELYLKIKKQLRELLNETF